MKETMHMAKISVIVPVYKVEKHFDRCVRSILHQTYTDFELILVDDGSPDKCGEMCENYASSDSRIHVIHQENGGLSAARNTGIDFVFQKNESEWITFVDSDDWIHPRYLELLFSAATVGRVNVSVCYALWTETEQLPEVTDEAFNIWNAVDYYREENTNATVAWGKLYRKECFCNIRYPAGKIHEDEFVTYRILFEQQSVAVVNQKLYGYFQNRDGITRVRWSPSRMDAVEGIKGQISYFLSHGYTDIAQKRFSILLYTIVKNIDQIYGTNEYSLSEKHKYLCFLRAELREALSNYRKYGWASLSHNRTAYVNSFRGTGFLRQVWLHKIKPLVHKG